MVAIFRLFAWIIAIVYGLSRRGRSYYADLSAESQWEPPSAHTPGGDHIFVVVGVVALLFGGLMLFIVGDETVVAMGMISLILGVVFLTFSLGGFVLSKNKTATQQAAGDFPQVIYTLKISQKTKWRHEQALQLMEQFALAFPTLILQIAGDETGVRWQIVDAGWGIVPTAIEQMIRTIDAQAEVDIEVVGSEKPAAFDPFFRYVIYYQQPNMFVAPLVYVSDLREVDPLASLAEVMSDLDAGERVIYSVIVNGVALDAYKRGEQMITQSTIHPLQYLSQAGIGDAIGKKIWGNDRMRKFEHRDQLVFEEKLRQKLYYSAVLIQVDAPDPDRMAYLIAMADTQLTHFTRMPYNALHYVDRPLDQYTSLVETAEQDQTSSSLGIYQALVKGTIPKGQQPPLLVLEPRELAALWHLPHEGFTAPQVWWVTPGQVTVPSAIASHKAGVLLGRGKFRGHDEDVYLSPEDRRTHINIVGKTGMGKSTLMHHLIHQDIQNGDGVAVIDPHGTLIQDILQRSIPEEREDDVVILDLADHHYPPPINPMRGQGRYANTGRIVDIIEGLFEGTEQYVRLAKYLRAAIDLLQGDAEATMRDLSRAFTDTAFRYHLLNQSDNPFVEDVWDTYDLQSLAQQRQIHEPVLSRIAPFYGNPILYPVLCHPDALDFKRFMQEQKIILISLALSDDLVPEQERNLVGSLVVAMLQKAGMREVSRPFYVYIDEVQRFVTTPLNVVLSEARKFGLSLTIANQFLGQLVEGNTLEAVMGNVGTTLTFRCSPADAKAIASYMRPEFTIEALTNLHRFQVATKLQQEGMTQPAFTLWTAPPVARPDDAEAREQRIRAKSIQNYTPKSRQEVLDWLKGRYPKRERRVVSDNEEATFYDKGDAGHDQTAAD